MRGVHRSRVTRWDKRGWVVHRPNGKIDLDESNRLIDQNLHRAKGRRRNGNITSSGPAIPPEAAINPPASRSESPVQGNGAPGQAALSRATDSQTVEPAPKSADEARYWAAKAQREEQELEQARLRTRKERAETELAEMKSRQMAGNLVLAAGVERAQEELGRKTRNAMTAVPDRTATVLASMTSPAEIHKYLVAEINKGLRGLSDDFSESAAAVDQTEEPEAALL
jgi:hypothetical protein